MLAMSNKEGTARPKVYNLFMVPPPVPGTERRRRETCLDRPSHMKGGFFKLKAKPTCRLHALSRGNQQSAKIAIDGKCSASVSMDLKTKRTWNSDASPR